MIHVLMFFIYKKGLRSVQDCDLISCLDAVGVSHGEVVAIDDG